MYLTLILANESTYLAIPIILSILEYPGCLRLSHTGHGLAIPIIISILGYLEV